MSQNLQTFATFAKFAKLKKNQLDNLVDFEKCCKTHIYLQKSVPIPPKTSNILPNFCQKLAGSIIRIRRSLTGKTRQTCLTSADIFWASVRRCPAASSSEACLRCLRVNKTNTFRNVRNSEIGMHEFAEHLDNPQLNILM